MKSSNPTLGELLSQGTRYLSTLGREAARLDAELLLGHLMHQDRGGLLLHSEDSVPPEIRERYEEVLWQRGTAVPVAYLTGEKEFMSLTFVVDPSVLIPRPETEILVEEIIKRYQHLKNPLLGVDIGTGSGCIAISLCHYLPSLQMVATDISPAALRLAQENAKRLEVAPRVKLFQSELFSEFGFHKIKQGSLDFIVSNPPYIPREEIKNLMADVLNEPQTALDGGPDGLDFYRSLIPGAPFYLKDGGLLALEIGADQATLVSAIFTKSGRYHAPTLYPDLSGQNRVILAEKKSG